MTSAATVERAPRLKVYSAFLALYVIWGSTYLAIRLGLESFPPFLFAGVRFLVAGGLLMLWARATTQERPTLAYWKSAAIVGAALLVGGNGGVVWAEQYVSSGLAALIIAMMPVWMVIIDALRPNGSLPRPAVIAGIVFGVVGLAVLVGPNVFSGGPSMLAIGALLLSCLSWASGSIYSRFATLPSSAILATSMEMLAGGALLAVIGLASGEVGRIDPGAITGEAVAALLYLVVFGSIVGYTAFIWLLRVAPPARVATYAYVNPIVAVLLGWALASEPVTARTIGGAAIILAAVVIINVTRDAPAPAQPQAEPVPERAASGER